MTAPSLRWRLLRDTGLALVILVGLEGVVRLAGLADGPDPAVPDNAIIEEGAGVGPYVEPAGEGMLQTSRHEAEVGRMRDLTFPVTPAPGTVRVVLLGGSVAKGVPIDSDPPRTIGGRLQAHLRRQGVAAEVLDLAGASYTTAHVAGVAADAMKAHPHAIVVYSGGNEYRAFTRRLWEQNQGWKGAIRASQGLHLVRMLGRVALWLRGGPAEPGQADDAVHEVIAGQSKLVASVMERLLADAGAEGQPRWGDDGVPVRRDPAAQAVVAAYEAGLREVLDAVDSAPSKPVLVLMKPPANRFTPPQLSLHTPGLPDAERHTFMAHHDRGQLAVRQGDCTTAVAEFEAALAIDSLYADTWHQHGKCLLELNDPAGTARRNLDIAVELDFAPDRAGRALYAVVDRLVAESDAVTVDLSDDFGPAVDYGRPLFHDHVHLQPRGQDRVAQHIADTLAPMLARPR